MKKILTVSLLLLVSFSVQLKAQDKKDNRIRVIAIFAHPDDADSKMGGTAALLAKMGVAVKFVALTNGDAGHYAEGGGVLGKRRREEAQRAAKKYGIEEYTVLNNHDGELLPDLNVRMQVIREIRKWNADVVLGLRPNDYHPDHRNAGKLVEDASYMVAVPNVAADVPALKKNPVFLYMQDHFKKPNPFSHDIVVAIDDVLDKKVDGLNEHTSQMYEWLPWIGNGGEIDKSVPTDPSARKEWLKKRWVDRKMSPEQRAGLEKWYGKEKAATIKFAESFEITEYGSQPSEAEIRRLFPVFK
ncbi:MAG: PIG-L family deacetylase [Sphingobacteriia bacterium]|nr:PIG-L family deacetylase [Sphingobacteriia bacterium]